MPEVMQATGVMQATEVTLVLAIQLVGVGIIVKLVCIVGDIVGDIQVTGKVELQGQ